MRCSTLTPWRIGRARGWTIVVAGLLGCAALLLAEDFGGGALDEVLVYLPGVDKVLHYVEYCLVFLVLWVLAGVVSERPASRLVFAAAGTLILGAADELRQGLVPQRSVELADYAANLCGLALGMALLARRRHRRLAAFGAVASLLLATVVTYDTYLLRKDFARGQRYQRQHEFGLARIHYLKALEAGLRTPALYNSLSWVEIESGNGDPVKAVEYGRLALADRPDNPDAMDTYGWALHHIGQSEEALVYLRQAFQKKPRMYCINYHLGVVLEALGRVGEAEKSYLAQIELNGEDEEVRRARPALNQLRRTKGKHRGTH